MQKFRPMIPYLFITEIAYYILPIILLAVSEMMLAVLMLFLIFPAITAVCAVLNGMKNKFHWLYPVVVFILFLPTVFLFYNLTALVYGFVYGLLALAGNWAGDYITTRKSKKDRTLK